MKRTSSRLLAASVIAVACTVPSHAQWLTQSFNLTNGWNAVFLHVDASHATLQELIDADGNNPIQEIWLWNPASSVQFVESPQLPTGTGSEWTSWIRASGPSSVLQRLIGNSAYLVRVATNSYTWSVKGKVVPPRYLWTTTGLNFLGFPTVTAAPPSFENFLALDADLQQNAQIFHYLGGELGANNPAELLRPLWRSKLVRRGEAFWIRSGTVFNRYFGPFEVVLQSADGVQFRDHAGQYRIRLRNLTPGSLTVQLQLVSSETPPAGQSPIVQIPPVLVRGALNLTNLTYSHTNLAAGPQQWTLTPKGQAGSEVEVVLGINRFQMPGNPGALYAGILRFTDSLHFSQMDVPVAATVPSPAGLWIGSALVSHVRHYLKFYEKDAAGNPVTSAGGQYTVTGINTNYGGVPRFFPLRLILHNDGAQHAVLLQRIYYGLRYGTNLALATQESLLDPAHLDTAKRISSVHLPWTSGNDPWPCTGELRQGASLTATVVLGHDDQASSPFLHTYHPDHDNLNATFDASLEPGIESYRVTREITLILTAPEDDFSSLTKGDQNLVGDYGEMVTVEGKGSETRQFEVRGAFALNRITDISILTKP